MLAVANRSASAEEAETVRKPEFKAAEQDEEILRETPQRFVLMPIRYPAVWRMHKQAEASIWHAAEIDFVGDMKDWQAMTEGERHFVKTTLAFFAASDGIVMENLAKRFLQDVQIPEARHFYSCQIFMESVHSEVYSLTLDHYIRDPAERDAMFQAIQHHAAIKKKAEWAMKWIANPHTSFATRLVAFACVEGIFFSGSFTSIFWLKKRNLLPGLCKSNEFISRDESLHTDFACLLYSMLRHRLPQAEVEVVVREAVQIEQHFVCSALPVSLIGMSAASMSQYIEFVADRLLDALGYPKIYHRACPFDFMEMISMRAKTNFFEHKVSEYQKPGVMDSLAAPKGGELMDDAPWGSHDF